MIYRTKFKIGEFSKLMQVTVKTLRLYEQKGLLQPDEVDENSGYRYYKLSGMQRLVAIRNLQKMGFSLSEIKEIFDSESHTPSLEHLDEKIIDRENLVIYIACKDDTIWDIAKKMNVSEDMIMLQNPNINLPIMEKDRIVVYKQKVAEK